RHRGRAGQREGREQYGSEERAASSQPRANRPKWIPAQSLPTTPGFVHAPNSTLEQSEWTSRPESNNVLFQALNRAWTKRFTASGEYSWYIDKSMKRVGRLCESTGTADRAATKYLNDFALKSTIRRDAAALKALEPHIGARDRRELAQRSGTRSDGYLIQAANRILSPGPPPRPCCGSPP